MRPEYAALQIRSGLRVDLGLHARARIALEHGQKTSGRRGSATLEGGSSIDLGLRAPSSRAATRPFASSMLYPNTSTHAHIASPNARARNVQTYNEHFCTQGGCCGGCQQSVSGCALGWVHAQPSTWLLPAPIAPHVKTTCTGTRAHDKFKLQPFT